MKQAFLETGRITAPHGIKGEMRVQPWTDDPELFARCPLFFDEGKSPVAVASARCHKSMVILKIEGIETADAAQALRDKILWVRREDLSLAQGEYFIQDLMGIEVFDEDSGRLYGAVCDITQTGANDVYHIQNEGKTVYIPAVAEVICSVDLQANRMTIRPIAGLFEDEN